jgi:hypothetical protein
MASVHFSPVKAKTETTTPEESREDQENLQFVPRKRRNDSHIVTPRKPLGQMTLKSERRESLTGGWENADQRVTRPRKSMRKSFRRASIMGNDTIATIIEEPSSAPAVEGDGGMELKAVDVAEVEGTITSPMKKGLRRSTRGARTSSVLLTIPLDSAVPAETATNIDEKYTSDAEVLKDNDIAKSSTPSETPAVFQESKHLSDETAGADAVAADDVTSSATKEGLETVEETSIVEPASVLASKEVETSKDNAVVRELNPNALPAEQEKHNIKIEENGIFETPIATLPQIQETSEEPCPEENLLDSASDSDNTSEDSINHVTESTPDSLAEERHEEEVEDECCAGPDGQTDGATISRFRESEQDAIPVAEGSIPVISIPLASEIAVAVEEACCFEAVEDDEAFSEDSNSVDHTAEDAVVEDLGNEQVTLEDAATEETTETINFNYEEDDTFMLQNFISRVKADKAAKKASPKRKRSLPHSPLRIPLGDINNLSPSGQSKDRIETTGSPSKRRKRSHINTDEDPTEPASVRRSGRTRIPMKTPLGAPSFIPVRRLGQDLDTTVTLKRNEEKDLAAVTRINTRKNKAGAMSALEVLARKAEEKEDPVLRQRALKEAFEEKKRVKEEALKDGKKRKNVVWAEELAQYQEFGAGKGKGKGKAKATVEKEKDCDTAHVKEVKEEKTEKAEKVEKAGKDKEKISLRVGVRSKIALGMATNGTPAKRKVRRL